MGTKEFGKMMERIQTLEEGRVPAKEAKKGRIEGDNKRITRKEYQRLFNNFDMEGLMAQEGLWKLVMKLVIRYETTGLCMRETSGAAG